ncbi:hypothetical protein [Aliikangiella sp. IMCC44359]|uniref:hypothetical protein n=1 Tax=Aliikangiella sp. IMCC44359 TaxID=3459125 RepID=UPI00403ABDC9
MKNSIILGLLFSLLVINKSLCALELSDHPKVYKGQEGVIVSVLPLKNEDKKQALIEVTGVDSFIDGKVWLYDLETQGQDKEAYMTMLDGRKSYRIRSNKGYWFKWTEVYIPGTNDKLTVFYDEKLSKSIDAKAYLRRYHNDRVEQQKIASFDRQKNISKHNKKFAELLSKVKSSCNDEFKASINWESIDDATLKKYSIYSFCGIPLKSLDNLCKNSDKMKAIVNNTFTSFDCRFGDKIKLKREDKTLHWLTDMTTSNQREFINAFFKNEL